VSRVSCNHIRRFLNIPPHQRIDDFVCEYRQREPARNPKAAPHATAAIFLGDVTKLRGDQELAPWLRVIDAPYGDMESVVTTGEISWIHFRESRFLDIRPASDPSRDKLSELPFYQRDAIRTVTREEAGVHPCTGSGPSSKGSQVRTVHEVKRDGADDAFHGFPKRDYPPRVNLFGSFVLTGEVGLAGLGKVQSFTS